MSSVLIVESPAKVKTLKKYLSGRDIEVLASYGHIRDLVPKQGAVDPAHQFAMKYQLIEKNVKHVEAIIEAVKNADEILLATDPDREGEAIAWHLTEILKTENLLQGKSVQRVVFHEITQTAVTQALENPRHLSMSLVNAQQARRALDYLVGFNLSPLLWKKIRRGLSAGRVQSPALRLIVEREIEIQAFQSQEYWSIHLESHVDQTKPRGKTQAQRIDATLSQYQGKKLKELSIHSESEQAEIVTKLIEKSQGNVVVQKIERKNKKRNPTAPFTTSTLQQEAVRKLNMHNDKVMRIAQQLYEGVEIDTGVTGLITYMRTDAVNLAQEAVEEIRNYISQHFEPNFLPKNPNVYKNKSKNAQEAHEAIRPTSIFRTPQSLRKFLTAEQYKLYDMIWKRTLACQLASAEFSLTGVDIAVIDPATPTETCGIFRANGQVVLFSGFLSVYEESFDDPTQAEQSDAVFLPALEVGQVLPVDRLFGKQHFTMPPPRFNRATLVKALEEYGIGRPSTYATIISTLLARAYVEESEKRFIATDVGRVVNRFLTNHFTRYVDYDFTAKLEDDLDLIANNEQEWVPVLAHFWDDFHQLLVEKQSLPREEITQEKLDEACPKCGNPLVIRLGKRGNFVGCSHYPECDYTRDLNPEKADASQAQAGEIIPDRTCPKCESALQIKKGKYGSFIGCTNYPKCNFIEPLEKPKDTGVTCPSCGKGSMIERKNRFGSIFYSCSNYPQCNYALPHRPIPEPCPECGSPILMLKHTKRWGLQKVCPNKECGYKISVTDLESDQESAPT